MEIRNWALTPLDYNPYLPPEAQPTWVHGEVYGSPRFVDGEKVTTSRILGVELDGDKLFVHTKSGSKYELGEPSAEYEAAYPGAKARLVARTKETTMTNDTYNVPLIAATLVKRLIRLRPETLRDIIADLSRAPMTVENDFLRDGALLALQLQELQVGDEDVEKIVKATLGSLV